MRFEGQAAMELEFALEGVTTGETYNLPLNTRHLPGVLDWSPMVEALLSDVRNGAALGKISAKFHNALVEAIVRVATRIECPRVALSGGCFQNRYLTERTVRRLREESFQPYWHQRVPPNDGGIALGQIVAARRELSFTRREGLSQAIPSPGQSATFSPSDGERDGVRGTPRHQIAHHATR
jgi:hydrogenase maturation protein HypF